MRDEYEPGVFVAIVGAGDVVVQQCGGYACTQEEVMAERVEKVGDAAAEERLLNHFTGEKWGGWCCDGIDESTARIVESIVPAFSVDRSRLQDSCEAWIHGNFGGREAILLWGNSD